MTAIRVRGPVLPDGEARDLYVVDGHITLEPVGQAETIAEGWIVPGLVDAHCHLGLGEAGPISIEETESTAIEDRDAGALLIRDCGSPIDNRWIQDREDLPRLIRAGRHVARTARYLRNYGIEVEPAGLVPEIQRQAALGDGWVKLVGDWISREEGDLVASFPHPDLSAAVEAAHAAGAKITAHCFGADPLAPLLDAGIDCIEHGTGLDLAEIAQMARQGTALVPTVMQTEKFTEFAAAGAAKFPIYSKTMTSLYAARREVLMNAYDAGVAMYAGTDGGGAKRHGNIAGEVLAMIEMGLPVDYALGAASWRAREWLGWNPTLSEGAPADFVVYPRDPLLDPSVLWEPSLIVLRGRTDFSAGPTSGMIGR